MNPMREAAASALAGTGAFLRCDRGGALYVTNLPVKCADRPDAAILLEEAGFVCRLSRNMLFLTPDSQWPAVFERWARSLTAPGELSLRLALRQSSPVCEEETSCWIEGVKRLDLGLRDADVYDRLVRRTAAVALRKKCGGLLLLCGLCLDLMKEDLYHAD